MSLSRRSGRPGEQQQQAQDAVFRLHADAVLRDGQPAPAVSRQRPLPVLVALIENRHGRIAPRPAACGLAFSNPTNGGTCAIGTVQLFAAKRRIFAGSGIVPCPDCRFTRILGVITACRVGLPAFAFPQTLAFSGGSDILKDMNRSLQNGLRTVDVTGLSEDAIHAVQAHVAVLRTQSMPPRQQRSHQEWSKAFHEWVNSHPKRDSFADWSRDSIYTDRGE